MNISRARPDPLTASIVMVDRTTIDVTVRQGAQVRLCHANALRAAIGLHLLEHGFTGNETVHTRNLHRREWPGQSSEYTNSGQALLTVQGKSKAAKLLKEARA